MFLKEKMYEGNTVGYNQKIKINKQGIEAKKYVNYGLYTYFFSVICPSFMMIGWIIIEKIK